MARAAEKTPPPGPDVLEGFPHPRAAPRLIGHREAAQEAASAFGSGRFHHAWLVSGPEGIGKATLAYRMARHVLANPDERTGMAQGELVAGGGDPLAIAPESRTESLVTTGAHPNLITLRRPLDDKTGKAKTVISVDEIRRIHGFFGTTAAQGGWRVAIVDAADEMNAAAANALLKTLEEPPARSLFIVISHQPGRLLPTIRSRCRLLDLSPLTRAEVGEGIDCYVAPAPADDARTHAIELCGGSLRLALQLLSPAGDDVRAVSSLLDDLPDIDMVALHRLADRIGRTGAQAAFALVFNVLRDWLAGRMRLQATRGGTAATLAPYAEVWERLDTFGRETEALNLDRKQAFLLVMFQLQDLLRKAA